MTLSTAINLTIYLIALAFGVFAAVRWRRQREPVLAGLGLRIDRNTAPDIGIGLAITTAAMVGILVILTGANGVRVSGGVFDPAAVLTFGLFLVIQSIIDETIMRGMLISGLALLLDGRRIAAVLVAAILFGLTHAFFEGASALSVISNSLGGVMYGLAFVLTGRIWLGVGLHFAWNFVQGPVLGFILSGHPVPGAPLHIDDLGPVWLTGGNYGPEGGIVGIGFRFVVIAAVVVWTGQRGIAMESAQ
ncbi:MAG TPA: CPBP family intramembrane glutamic endopeptidase [Alphaproteobacteria bacterium]|nr:CPBP family intramembrane glutamic endopeptidase [Alphaproteobacteria bacterium]